MAFLYSCSEDSEPADPFQELTQFQQQVIEYFPSVAIGAENGDNNTSLVVKKWVKENPMKLHLSGDVTEDLKAALNETIATLNELTGPEMSIELTENRANANATFLFSSKSDAVKEVPEWEEYIDDSNGLHRYFYHREEYRIFGARMWVNTSQPSLNRIRHVMIEELVQSLGISRDSGRYPDSIFYETARTSGSAIELSPIDMEIVRLLYHPDIIRGMDRNEARTALIRVYQKENQ